jgi:hypothetical protein
VRDVGYAAKRERIESKSNKCGLVASGYLLETSFPVLVKTDRYTPKKGDEVQQPIIRLSWRQSPPVTFLSLAGRKTQINEGQPAKKCKRRPLEKNKK